MNKIGTSRAKVRGAGVVFDSDRNSKGNFINNFPKDKIKIDPVENKEISLNTLHMIDESAKNLAKGVVGEPIDFILPIGTPADATAFIDHIIEDSQK